MKKHLGNLWLFKTNISYFSNQYFYPPENFCDKYICKISPSHHICEIYSGGELFIFFYVSLLHFTLISLLAGFMDLDYLYTYYIKGYYLH